LQEELTGTEGRIAYARQFYNDTVQRYNTKIQTFPTVVLAGMFHFTQREYFEVEETARDAVHVSFDTPPAATPPAQPTPPAPPASTQP
jgi:LemA protein